MEDSQMQSKLKLSVTNPTHSAKLRVFINGLTGLFLISLGLYHNLAGGSLVSQWLSAALQIPQGSLHPPLNPNDANMVQLGFEMGGYLAIAIGLSFILLGNSLPKGYYLLWAIFFLVLGGLSLYTFQTFHESQLVWILTILLGGYYLALPDMPNHTPRHL
jgi:hypothetical protein